MRAAAALALALLAAPGALAGEADVVAVKATPTGATWRFDVTVRHADAGWAHYADRWDVVGPDGKVLASRVLLHPHDAEQPFTRSLTGVRVPAGVTRVVMRANDKVHGLGGKTMIVELKPAE
jgi:hypothetical protein